MGRSPCCDENGLKKGPWTPEEDQKLIQYIQKNGHGSWRALPKLAGLNRCGKSCRLRWTNYLRPDIKRGKFSPEEEQTILHLHSILGNKWSAIATHLPGRTDNEIKNFWNTHLKKKLIHTGIDPTTHQPRMDVFDTLPQLMALTNLRGILENHAWNDDAARLLAEALRLAKLQCFQYLFQSPATISNTNSITSKMDFMSLLNTQIPSITSVPSPSLYPVANSQAQLHGLPEMSCSFQQPFGNYTKQDSTYLMVGQEEKNAVRAAVSPPLSLPGVADDLLRNGDNCCSTSSHGWSEFFDDPLMTGLI